MEGQMMSILAGSFVKPLYLALLMLAATGAAAMSQEELFGSHACAFDVESFPSNDYYVYFSEDDICWVELEGNLDDIDIVWINTEPGSSSEISEALGYQLHFLSKVFSETESSELLEELIAGWESTGRTQTTRVEGVEVEFYMESLGGGLMGYNTKMTF